MRAVLLLVLVLPIGGCAGGGDDGAAIDAGIDASPDPAATRITSTPGWLARSATLTIDPALADGATIDLGPGVTVGAVTRAASSSEVDVSIAPDAVLGVRSATIVDGGETEVVPDALTIVPSLDASLLAGAPARGGLFAVSVASRVPDASPGWWPFSLGPDLYLLPDSPVDFSNGVFLVAPGAGLGPRALQWSAPSDALAFATGPGAITIADREPLPLVAGDTAVGALAAFETRTYRLQAGSPEIASFHADAAYEPVVWIFQDGVARAYRAASFDDAAIELEVPVAAGDDALDLVAYDQTPWHPSQGYTFHVDLADAVEYGPDGGDHANEASAMPVDGCATACIISGTIAAGQTQVFAVPPRSLLGTFPRWTFALDGDLAITAHVGAAGHERVIPNRASPLRAPYIVDDAETDRPYYLSVRSTSTTPVTYRFSARRYGVP